MSCIRLSSGAGDCQWGLVNSAAAGRTGTQLASCVSVCSSLVTGLAGGEGGSADGGKKRRNHGCSPPAGH